MNRNRKKGENVEDKKKKILYVQYWKRDDRLSGNNAFHTARSKNEFSIEKQ